MEPLYSSDVTTPGCWVFIGGGGIREAEDAKAAAGESLRYPAGTGMAPASLTGHRRRAVAVWAIESVGVSEEEGGRTKEVHRQSIPPVIAPRFSLLGTKLPEK